MLDFILNYHMTLFYFEITFWLEFEYQGFAIYMRCCYGRYQNMQFTSGLLILLHDALSLQNLMNWLECFSCGH